MKILALFYFVLSFWTYQASTETTWKIAPGRSSVKFKVKHLLLFNVEGKFKKFEGKVVTQDKDFTNAQIEAVIESNSIHTGNRDRDKDLQGEHFFYTSEFERITFKSKSIAKIGEDDYKIIGDLTIRDTTKTIELIAEFTGLKELANGKSRADFIATGTLNRLDYGLKWNEFLETGKAIVGETVEIILKIALLKEDE